MLKTVICVLTLMSGVAEAKLKAVNLSLASQTTKEYFNFTKEETGPKKFPENKLYAIKKAYFNNEASQCLDLIVRYQKRVKVIQPWMMNQQLLCGEMQDFKKRTHRKRLAQIFTIVGRKTNYFLVGAQAEELKANYLRVGLIVLEHLAKDNRTQAWKVFEALSNQVSELSDDQKAQLYLTAGEISFIQQDLVQAKNYYLRSLRFGKIDKVVHRLKAIDPKLFNDQASEGSATTEDLLLNSVTEDERNLVLRMRNALKSEDLLNVVSDAVDLMRRFPKSYFADWADKQVLSIYMKLASRSEERLKPVILKVRDVLNKVDGIRLYRFAKRFYDRGLYEESQWLGQVAYGKLKGQERGIGALKVSADSRHFLGDYSEAKKEYELIFKVSSGTKLASKALFKLGLISFREQKYSDSVSYFERLLALPDLYDFELSSLYWLWRAKQKVHAESARSIATQIFEKYPVSYYGIRAYAETHGEGFKWVSQGPLALKSKVRLTSTELASYKKHKLLVGGGWYKEAVRELEILPEPVDAKDKILYAQLWAEALHIRKAVELSFSSFRENLSWIRWNTVDTIYPRAYRNKVVKWAKANSIDPHLVWALIRQESSFDNRAVSPSNAVGLMQLVRITAGEVAQDLNFKNFTFPESLYDPKVNIRFGSYYLKKMIRANKGYIPLALASYNAGIGRTYRWIKSRKDLSDLRSTNSSSPESELWIDELPWGETRYYVKSVMRNYLIYQLMEKQELKLNDTLWK